MIRLLMAARLLGSVPRPVSSKSSGFSSTSCTFGALKVSSFAPGGSTRAGWYSNQAWLPATLSVCPGTQPSVPANSKIDCQAFQEISWLSQMQTKGQRARASCRSGSCR